VPVLPPLLPPNDATRITVEILDTFKRALTGDHEARTEFTVLTKGKPWEISPLEVLKYPDGPPEGLGDAWTASWKPAMAFRQELDLALAQLN
jgi:hypothetical protein